VNYAIELLAAKIVDKNDKSRWIDADAPNTRSGRRREQTVRSKAQGLYITPDLCRLST
jgi:hypothetical protein